MKADLTLGLDHVDEFVHQRCVPGTLGLELARRAALHLHVNSSMDTAKAMLNQTMGPYLMVGLTAAVVADLLPPEPQLGGVEMFSPQVVAEFARELSETWQEEEVAAAQAPPTPASAPYPASSYQTPPPSSRGELPAPSAPNKRGRKRLHLTPPPARRPSNVKTIAAGRAASVPVPNVAAAGATPGVAVPAAATAAAAAAAAAAPSAVVADALLKSQPLVASQEELTFALESAVVDDGALGNMSQAL